MSKHQSFDIREDKVVTIIVGMYYNCKQGAIVVADSRAMRGGDYSQDQKLFKVSDDVLFASSGLSGMVEKLLPSVEKTRLSTRRFLTSEILEIFEDEMAKLNERYKYTRPYRFSTNETLLRAIIGLIDENKPKLYTLYDNGYGEIIRDYHAVGHGARHAQNILRTLYKPDVTKDRAIEIAVHVLSEVAEVDAMVDAYPQVGILELDGDKATVTVLNEDEGGEFNILASYAEPIKGRVKGIEQKRAEIFHAVLDGKINIDDIVLENTKKEKADANKKPK